MRSSALRHVIRLRLTLAGPIPEIWREIVIDRDLMLADLRCVIQSVFDGHACSHHLFTDRIESPTWSRIRRRWGDRETMIDLRDPTIIDEATARIGRVLREEQSLFYGHTCENGWLVQIEQLEDDLVDASTPSARVTGGERRAPLPCCRGAYEHAVLVGVLADSTHPEHDALRRRIAQTIGPWLHFDSEEFDLDAAKREIDALGLTVGAPRAVSGRAPARGAPRRSGPLSWVVARLPRAARPGLERHLAASGLGLPTVVTTEEAEAVTRELAWILSRAVRGGIPFVDGKADTSVVQEGVDALACSSDRVERLVALAKRGHLLYLRSGRLLANKRSLAAAEGPVELWSLLARDVVRSVAPRTSGDLFLLAIADGSLSDPAVGVRRSAEALTLMRHDDWCDPRSSPYDYDGHQRFGDCDQSCDCPGAETWHDVVARAIRDAAAVATGGDAVPLAQSSGIEASELGFAPEWLAEPYRYSVATRTAPAMPVDEAAFLVEVDGLIQDLALFGLERADDGSWIVPPTLQELARASLQRGTGSGHF